MTARILIIEDEEEFVWLLRRKLEKEGYDIVSASDGVSGLELVQKKEPNLVLLDVMMPRMNGWELSRIIKERSPDTPVVVISGSYDDKLWEKVNMNWVDAIFIKPFKPEEIEGAVRRLLNRGI